MPKVFANDINIHYQTAGQGPEVVMIHGLTGNLAFWYFSIFHELAKDFRVTIYDLRGHGYSDAPEAGYKCIDMVNDLKSLIEKLGIEKPHIIGHSFGGIIALHFAMLYPDRLSKIVLADTGLMGADNPNDISIMHWWKDRLLNLGVSLQDDESDDISHLIEKTKQLREKISSKIPERIMLDTKRITYLAEKTSCLKDCRVGRDVDFEKLRELDHPVLMTCGDRSLSIDGCRYFGDRLPKSKTMLINNSGHFHPLEQPDIFIKAVREHLINNL
jgi:2-hydroxy-6-oxonona-2,4-dienedioate hydrolase